MALTSGFLLTLSPLRLLFYINNTLKLHAIWENPNNRSSFYNTKRNAISKYFCQYKNIPDLSLQYHCYLEICIFRYWAALRKSMLTFHPISPPQPCRRIVAHSLVKHRLCIQKVPGMNNIFSHERLLIRGRHEEPISETTES